jgi:hypothetical protein
MDDILAVYTPKYKDRMDEFELKLISRYQVRTLREVEHFLGIRIVHN